MRQSPTQRRQRLLRTVRALTLYRMQTRCRRNGLLRKLPRDPLAQSSTPWSGVGNRAEPGVALALGFIPGVGAIYNGQIAKAFVQVLIFGSLIALGDRVHGPWTRFSGWAPRRSTSIW